MLKKLTLVVMILGLLSVTMIFATEQLPDMVGAVPRTSSLPCNNEDLRAVVCAHSGCLIMQQVIIRDLLAEVIQLRASIATIPVLGTSSAHVSTVTSTVPPVVIARRCPGSMRKPRGYAFTKPDDLKGH